MAHALTLPIAKAMGPLPLPPCGRGRRRRCPPRGGGPGARPGGGGGRGPAPMPPAPRLYVPDDLRPGATLALAEGQAHYLRNVLRLGAGAGLALFNGRDGEWRGRIDGIAKARCTVVLEAQTRKQVVEPDLWLVFAPVKRARIDYLVEKATELGVAALCPVRTERTIV